MPKKKGFRLLPIAIGAASVGLAAAALAKGIPLLKEKLSAKKEAPKPARSVKAKPVRRRKKKAAAR